jgi:cell division protein ZapA
VAEKNRVDVRIGGNDYTLIGAESEEFIHKVAHYIDKKMNEIIRGSTKLSTSMAAVLTAVNVADEFIKSRERENIQGQELKHLRNELESLMSERNRLMQDNAFLSEQYSGMQIEMAKREAELNEVRNSLDKMTSSKLYIAK